MDQKKFVKINRVGWHAIKHKDGWWVGTDDGVTCYRTLQLASAALTIIWQREGGKKLEFKIAVFNPGKALVRHGEHYPLKSAKQALEEYEAHARRN